MFDLIKLLLKATHYLARKEEAKQALRQVKFKRDRARLAKRLKNEAAIAHAKANALSSQAATAWAHSTIGSNSINEAERVAASLRASLDHVVSK